MFWKEWKKKDLISQEEKEGAQKEELKFNKLPKTQAVHFVEFVKQQLEDIYGSDFLEIKVLKIYTTLGLGIAAIRGDNPS